MSERPDPASPVGAAPDANPVPKRLLPPAWRQDELSFDDGGMRGGPHWTLWTIIAFIVIALLWSSFAMIDELARAEGRVITASQTQLIQNLEGGIIGKIFVREGDLVEKDQIMFQLDDVRFVSALREGAQGTWGLKAKVARLTAEVQKGRPLMPADVLRNAPALAQNEIAVYDARQRDLSARNAVLQEQLSQRRQEVMELQSKRDRSQDQLELLRKEITITAPLVKQGAVSEVELLRLERESSRLVAEVDAAKLAIPRTQSAVDEVRRRIEDNESQFRAQAAAELSTARNELAKVSESMPALEDRVTRTAVRSPVRGTVKTIANKTPGGVVQAGTPLAEVVPVEETLLVEARIRPQDIAFVSVGQRAIVKFAAYDYSIYGGLEGKVEYVSADSIQPQAQNAGAAAVEPYYLAHVRTAKSAIEHEGRALPIIPGMTASVDVLTGERTVLYYLLKPINKARGRALTER